MKYTMCALGKYAYFDYYRDGSVKSYVIVNNNSYSDYNTANKDALSKVDIVSLEDRLQITRYKKENCKWIPVERTERLEENNNKILIHFRTDNDQFYCDYEKIYYYDDDNLLLEYETIRHKDNRSEIYSIEYEYDTAGTAIAEYHYINGALDHVEYYSFSSNLERASEEMYLSEFAKTFSNSPANQTKSSNSNIITVYKYDISIIHDLPFGHLDFAMNGVTYSYGTNTEGISNYFRKLIHSEPGYLFEAFTEDWTDSEPFNHYSTTNISLSDDEITALAASLVLIIMLCTQYDADASTDDVEKHKFISGDYQYYDYTSANCVTFVLDLLYGIIPDRIDDAGDSLWGARYNLSGIYTVSKAFKLLREV